MEIWELTKLKIENFCEFLIEIEEIEMLRNFKFMEVCENCRIEELVEKLRETGSTRTDFLG